MTGRQILLIGIMVLASVLLHIVTADQQCVDSVGPDALNGALDCGPGNIIILETLTYTLSRTESCQSVQELAANQSNPNLRPFPDEETYQTYTLCSLKQTCQPFQAVFGHTHYANQPDFHASIVYQCKGRYMYMKRDKPSLPDSCRLQLSVVCFKDQKKGKLVNLCGGKHFGQGEVFLYLPVETLKPTISQCFCDLTAKGGIRNIVAVDVRLNSNSECSPTRISVGQGRHSWTAQCAQNDTSSSFNSVVVPDYTGNDTVFRIDNARPEIRPEMVLLKVELVKAFRKRWSASCVALHNTAKETSTPALLSPGTATRSSESVGCIATTSATSTTAGRETSSESTCHHKHHINAKGPPYPEAHPAIWASAGAAAVVFIVVVVLIIRLGLRRAKSRSQRSEMDSYPVAVNPTYGQLEAVMRNTGCTNGVEERGSDDYASVACI